MAPQTAQINVKLDRDLKLAGDTALLEAGSNPSEAVRNLWIAVSERGEKRDAVLKLLDPAAAPTEDVEVARKLEARDRATHLFEGLGEQLGLNLDSFTPITDEEIEEARLAHFREKGYTL